MQSLDRSQYLLLAEYNQWMNQNLYAVCAEIPDEKRKEDLGAFFKSIHGTLNHLLFGDRVWLGRFIGKPYAARVGQELYADFAKLRQEREQTDQQILDWAAQLSSDWLNQSFEYTSNIDRKTRIICSQFKQYTAWFPEI